MSEKIKEKSDGIVEFLKELFGEDYFYNHCYNKKTCENGSNDIEYENKYNGYKAENMFSENETYTGVRLLFAVPGFSKEDMKVSLLKNIITVSSEKTNRIFGKLDHKVKIKFDIANISCVCEKGLLVIEVSKKIKDEEKTTIIDIE